jgi:regulator of ribonuclease activity A
VVGGAARANGWAGIVIWGAVRDVEALAALDLGVMALAATPRRCVRSGEGEAGAPVWIEGVRVAPGDTIVADADGALVFPAGGPAPE